MKACRKCQTLNDSNARFCYQCGSKIQSGLPNFKIPSPVTSKPSAKLLNPEKYIVHPLQEKSQVITSENQGSLLAPQLTRKLGLENENTTNAAKETESFPEPANLDVIKKTAKLAIPEEKKVTGLKIREFPTVTVSEPEVEKKNAEPVISESSHTPENPKVDKKRSLLNPADREVFQKQLKHRKFSSGVQVQNDPFSGIRTEKLEEKKRVIDEERRRKKRIQQDMAYLEKLFPNGQLHSGLRKAPQETANLPETMDKNLDQNTTVATGKEQMKRTAPNEPSPQNTTPAPKATQPRSEKKSTPPKQLFLGKSKAANTRSNKKNSTNKSLEHLNKFQHRSNGSELMTPFLTFAAFLYFCYVLYI
jgi:hypothetical protein